MIRGKGLGLDIKKHVDSGNLFLRQVDAAELSPGQLIHEIRQLVEKQDLKLLIIDSLNGFLNAMPGEKFLAMQLHELLGYLSQKGITTLMTVAQHGFVGTNIDTPVDVSYLADTVLLFRYFEAAGEVRQALSVIKKRSGEHERTIRELVMKNGAIGVGTVLTEFDGVLTGAPNYRGEMESLHGSKSNAKPMYVMTSREDELRVLVVAPTGRDGQLICNLLASNGISCVAIPSAVTARIEAKMNAGAVILAEEVLTLAGIDEWAELIAGQPSWSDLPVILLTVAGEVDRESQRKMRAREPLGNVMLIERPVRPETFVSTVQAALRSRERQYQMRDHLAARHIVEEALRRSEKLAVAGRLAASIAHEINNPLNSVTNLLYLIGSSSSLEQSKRYGEIAAEELARVAEIVTQTLRFYRESSKPVIVQIPEIVDSALMLYQGRLIAAGIVVERDFRECSPIVARAGELRQLILNLIGNALDATRRGGRLKIRVTNTREHRNGSRPGIRLTIADTGSGIHPEIRKTLRAVCQHQRR